MKQNLSWIADEYKHHQRDTGWYAGMFLTGAILVAWSLYTNNIIATILFVLIIGVLYLHSKRLPKKMVVELSERGITLNGMHYPYTSLKYFWIFYRPPHIGELQIETKAALNRRLTIELEDQDPQEVRLFLKQHLKEKENYQENFIDYLVRTLRL